MRMFLALLLTTLAVVLQDCRGDNHCTPPEPVCFTRNYYEINGYCNSAIKKRAGSVASPYCRYLTRLPYAGAPKYTGFMSTLLPSPREVSTKLFPCHDGTESAATHLFAIFGQILMFDMFHTERSSTVDPCCSVGSNCYGIDTNAANDPRNPSCPCLPYTRPTLIKNIDCTGSETEGKNKITHVIDASFMYSPIHYLGNIPPGTFAPTSTFFLKTGNPITGVADPINKNPLVLALTRVFMDEHNKLVAKMTEFSTPNPSAEARKLLIGIFQHITYNEYLPMLLGASTSVTSLSTGTRPPTLPAQLPMVCNYFTLTYSLAMASMMRETVTIDPNSTPNVNVKTMLNDATTIDTDAKKANIVQGMLKDCSLKIGKKIPCDFRNDCAYSDIVSVLHQDSLYLGIPTYYVWLVTLGVNQPETLPLQDTASRLELLSSYGPLNNPYDIGFLPGVFSETITAPNMLGPSLLTLFEKQFKRLQEGDRLYYENEGVFETYQLEEIRKMTMAHLLCRNVNGLTQVKSEAFKCASTSIDCSTLEDIDFCNYHCISRSFSDFQPSVINIQCVTFQIEVRQCKSTNPTLCPCLDVPFRITPCPNNLITLQMKALYEILGKVMASDEDSMYYYSTNNIRKLYERARELYKNMEP